MLEAAERLLRQHGARKVTLSDVAAACGMSQSNAYRFFASRQALLDAVGDRWFAGIERELEQIVASNEPPAQQFVRFVARQYEFKRERAVEDPELFSACFALPDAGMTVADRHLNRIRAQMEAILQRCADAGLIGGRDPAAATELVEALTERFREPAQILRYAKIDSARSAAEAAGIILAGLAHLPR